MEAPISFYVEDVCGPLLAQEENRAATFGLLLLRDLERRGMLVGPADRDAVATRENQGPS
jgi:hypothetical protein